MTEFLLICSVIIIICIMASRLSHKIGVPSLLLFMLIGILFGSDGIFRISFSNYALTEILCSFMLIFIMFYGGFGTNWKTARPVAAPAFLLASVGVFMTAGIVSVFCHFILKFPWMESLLIGSVISSTDAASVFSILRSRNLNLKNGLAPMLEIESGSNDPAAYMLTIIFIGMLSGDTSMSIPLLLFTQITFGVLTGILLALFSTAVLKRNLLSDGLDTIFTVAIALIAWSFAAFIGGNGYLSVYLCGLILGNSSIKNKVTLVHFFDGLTGLMQFTLFFLLGLLAHPSQMGSIILPSVAIALFLTFIGRPLSVFALLSPFRFGTKDKLFLSWSGLRGAASIVFAIMVTVSDIAIKNDIFHIVFCVSVLSVAFQGTLLPFFALKLDLVDDEEPVMKTFNDYIDESDVQLVEMKVGPNHTWKDKKLTDVELPLNSLVVMIERDGDTVLPKGNTTVLEGDKVILSARAYENKTDLTLWEQLVEKDHPWIDKRIWDLELSDEELILMIRRGDNTLIPRGETRIRENDVLILRS